MSMDCADTHQLSIDPSQKENTPPTESAPSRLNSQLQPPKETLNKRTKSSAWFKRAEKMANRDSPSRCINDITNDLTRGAPTDGVPEAHSPRSAGEQEIARRRNQYYDDAFAVRETYNTSRNRVNQDAVVAVQIKTNATISNTSKILAELSCHLSLTFQRPESSIMVAIDHGIRLIFGGTYEPAYHVTVTALPHLIGPASNLRNTILIQRAMQDILDIPASRGVVKFEPITEDNLGTNGATIRDEIVQLEKKTSASSDGIMKNISRTMSRRIKPASRVNPALVSPMSSNPSQEIGNGEDGSNMPGCVPGTLGSRHTIIPPLNEGDETGLSLDAGQQQHPESEVEIERGEDGQELDQKQSKYRVLRKYKSIKKHFTR